MNWYFKKQQVCVNWISFVILFFLFTYQINKYINDKNKALWNVISCCPSHTTSLKLTRKAYVSNLYTSSDTFCLFPYLFFCLPSVNFREKFRYSGGSYLSHKSNRSLYLWFCCWINSTPCFPQDKEDTYLCSNLVSYFKWQVNACMWTTVKCVCEKYRKQISRIFSISNATLTNETTFQFSSS